MLRIVLYTHLLTFVLLWVSSEESFAQNSPAQTTLAPAEAAHLSELLIAAEAAELHKDRYWHTLLHYKRGLFGLRSLVDDPKFFASPKGKHDPRAELEATLRSFFAPTTDGKSPVCRFLARYEWLREELGIDDQLLPTPGCDRFEELFAQIAPKSASLIFPTSHMNSPASMYGHTLLTIESESGSALLSYAVNYSAVTTETFGPLYMANGLLGRYPGYFSILPYYAKLQEYSDVSDRDIWEYPLELTLEEIRRLVQHIFELEDVYSNYFFFSENCSYNLLFLLDVARPGLGLTDQFGWWVLPIDTIRAVRGAGLISEAIYRPSRSTKVLSLADRLSNEDRHEAWSIAWGRSDPVQTLERDIPHGDKVRICDLASEYLQYIHAKGQVEKSDYVPRFLGTLKARSSLGEAGDDQVSVPSSRFRPDEGHQSNRFSLGVGWEDDEVFEEIRIRPAYHDLLDSGRGYKHGSQIIFLETVLRHRPRREKVELVELDAIDIVSLAPRNQFFRPTSWKFQTGLQRRVFRDGEDRLVYGFNPGFGWAYENPILGLSYALIETDLQVGGVLENNFSFGAGGSLGFIQNLSRRWKAHVFARGLTYRLGDELDHLQIGVGQSLRLTTNLNLSLEFERNTDHEHSTLVSTLRGRVFF